MSTAIDDKKTENSGQSGTTLDFKGFFKNYLISILFTISICVFLIGSLGLYTTKVVQANILPDDIELAPYTILDRVVKDIPIDLHVMRSSFMSENKDTLSQKALFQSQAYLDSFSKSILCSLKKSATPESGLFANAPLFFSSVYENIIAKNFLAINAIFGYLSYLPESCIMLLYGLLGIFIWVSLYFFNVCISIFYHIMQIPLLFKTVSEENSKMWESSDSTSFFRLTKLVLFFCLWIPLGFVSVFCTPVFFTIYGILSPLYATYKVKPKQTSSNVFDFIKDTFVYKKMFFFILATLSLVSNGVRYLGTTSIIGIALAVAFAYFMGFYTNELPEPGIDGFSYKINQAVKRSHVAEVNFTNPKLVEICTRVPIKDSKVEKWIQNGQFRPIVKYSGGDSYSLMPDETNTNGTNGTSVSFKDTEDIIPEHILSTPPSANIDDPNLIDNLNNSSAENIIPGINVPPQNISVQMGGNSRKTKYNTN